MQRSPRHPRTRDLIAGYILYFICSASFCSHAQESQKAPEAPKKSTELKGTIHYQPDASKPWRFGRYYLHGPQKLLAEAVVELVPADEKTEFPVASERTPKTHLMDQENFMFVPETLAIHAGDKVRFKNSEEAFHNVMCLDDKPPFNVNLAKGQDHIHLPKLAEGVKNPLHIRCVFHGAMQGWIFVFKHPFFHQTDKSGTFHFTGFPEGRYKLRVAHPSGGLFLETKEREWSKSANEPWNITLTPEHLKAQSE